MIGILLHSVFINHFQNRTYFEHYLEMKWSFLRPSIGKRKRLSSRFDTRVDSALALFLFCLFICCIFGIKCMVIIVKLLDSHCQVHTRPHPSSPFFVLTIPPLSLAHPVTHPLPLYASTTCLHFSSSCPEYSGFLLQEEVWIGINIKFAIFDCFPQFGSYVCLSVSTRYKRLGRKSYSAQNMVGRVMLTKDFFGLV